MALVNRKLVYSKLWTNSDEQTGFPTYEANETKVREDMQLLFDEAANALNALIDALKASEIPFTSSTAVPANNVQAAIENVQSQLSGVVLDQIPDGSISGDKLEEGAVGTRELDDDAVTLDKMADDSVGPDQLCEGAVHTEHIYDGAVTPEKLDPNATWFPNKADLDADDILVRSQRRLRVRAPSISSGYTLTLADAEAVLVFTNTGNGTVNIPANSSVAIKTGAMITMVCSGTARVTLHPASGVTLFALGSSESGDIVIKKQNTVVLLFKVATNKWFALIPGVRDGQVGTDDLAGKAVTSAKLASTDNGGTAAVAAKNIQPGAVSYDKTDGQTIQPKISKVNTNLTVAGWNSTTKKQTVTVTGLKQTGGEFIAAPNNKDGWEAAADAVLYPPVISANNKLTFECGTVPTEVIPITVYFWED